MWFWLAKIISGSSQQDRTSRGVDSGSVAKNRPRDVQPDSEGKLSHVRLVNAMQKLWASAVGHNHFGRASQIVGRSMKVGRRIFSIVGD